ncbi:phospho-N-acetylmuramoyl-pentapeptide-transferase [Planococcus lenghuensis]|uniref:Phospho-N-acetylmuramoyl-pentapeptide-transferase n=1 Tax=Planococcus lenghuensis TaxID=2213202 RepID=A0A1Q2L178_9BACL|nr:phospho-N-acetylmuramoyl-pentapeptide-transferase [Planococcus lenghuensis]AQQ53797.1 phospho-N-acetylmuramoyl-pentapeptide-transferase [Planococcus lenghuensis]
MEGMSLLAAIISFTGAVLLVPALIPLLRRLKFGQSIREAGPESHQKKTGTPTMGGVVFLPVIIITAVALSYFYGELTEKVIALVIALTGFGLIGFLDDYIKVAKKRNLGLTSLQKLLAQIAVALVTFFVLRDVFDTAVSIPFTAFEVELSWAYALFIVFWMVGFSNAVNLTDGLDGLVAGTSSAAFAAFGFFALLRQEEGIAIFAFAAVGGMLGFLVHNKFPAKLFMGDTGSLALGGALAMISILLELELLLLLIGIVFVIETLSVILQVASFKLRKKRIFKMSPIHHHFELIGWSEWKVVSIFWSAGLLAAVLALWLEVI